MQTSLKSNYPGMIKMMVSGSLGWSALPAATVDESMRVLPLTGLSSPRRLGIVMLKPLFLRRVVRTLSSLLLNDLPRA